MYKELLISALWAVTAFGQGSPAVTKQVFQMSDPAAFGGVGITTVLAAPMEVVTGAPYSAQVTTERLQVLVDGNRITQTSSGSVARDSQGRMRRDETLPGLTSASGDAPHMVMIDDPVAQVHWTLDAQTKTAIKMATPGIMGGRNGAFAAIPPPITGEKTWFYSAGGTGSISGGKVQILKKDAVAGDDPSATEVDLGTQTMEGVAAKGKRITRTIPAGQIGNEQPIVITTETWYSPDLKVLIMSKSSDPRMGETTYKLTNIQRAEPAASLFQAPEDYTVKDQPGNNMIYRDVKKTQ